jgi:hypothetical protein
VDRSSNGHVDASQVAMGISSCLTLLAPPLSHERQPEFWIFGQVVEEGIVLAEEVGVPLVVVVPSEVVVRLVGIATSIHSVLAGLFRSLLAPVAY